MAAKKRNGWTCTVQVLLLLMLTTACKPMHEASQDEAGENGSAQPAAWLSDMIREMEEKPVANPPAKVYRYTYQDREVYYLTSRCCDIPSQVYDADGNLLCEPEGGITGKGDGRCPDFLETRTNETLIWEDKREQN